MAASHAKKQNKGDRKFSGRFKGKFDMDSTSVTALVSVVGASVANG